MPPGWKTFDEGTAAALRSHVDEDSVSVDTVTQPLFADGDSVVIAPTLQKGAALVITARKKVAPAPVAVEDAAPLVPPLDEIAGPEVLATLPVEPVDEPILTSQEPTVIEEQEIIDGVPKEGSRQEPEFTFGPTTWERVEETELPGEFTPPEREIRSTDPEIWDLPSQAPPPPLPENIPPAQEGPAATNSEWQEEHYVATGFLGLDDYVEDEQEILRAKRPWWKRIFSD